MVNEYAYHDPVYRGSRSSGFPIEAFGYDGLLEVGNSFYVASLREFTLGLSLLRKEKDHATELW